MHNTEHNADIVITGDTGRYVVWWKNDVIANVSGAGLDLIIAGAAAHCLTVYNAETAQWLVATIDRLDDDVFTDETPGEGYRYRDHAGQGEA